MFGVMAEGQVRNEALEKDEDLHEQVRSIRDRGRPDNAYSIRQMSTGPVKWPLGDVCLRERFRLERTGRTER